MLTQVTANTLSTLLFCCMHVATAEKGPKVGFKTVLMVLVLDQHRQLG
jgi:hypothetical protein